MILDYRKDKARGCVGAQEVIKKEEAVCYICSKVEVTFLPSDLDEGRCQSIEANPSNDSKTYPKYSII